MLTTCSDHLTPRGRAKVHVELRGGCAASVQVKKAAVTDYVRAARTRTATCPQSDLCRTCAHTTRRGSQTSLGASP
eukprot:2200961-Prymnesium_polylepis.3